MNLKAIVASLVLGSSSLAAASPAVTVSAKAELWSGSPTATVVRDHRSSDWTPAAPPAAVHVRPSVRPDYVYQSPPIWNHQMHRPVLLASDQRFAHGRTSISVADHGQKYTTLQISAAGGRTYIGQVYIEFGNGERQLVKQNTTLTGSESLTVDLEGKRRTVKRVVVYGKNLWSGWRATSGFTVTAT